MPRTSAACCDNFFVFRRFAHERYGFVSKPSKTSSHVIRNQDDLFADDLTQAVEQLADAFAAKAIRYAVVGGLATTMRGRPHPL